MTTVACGGSFVQQKKRVDFLRPQNATYLLYHGVATTVPLSVLTTLYIHYTPWIATFSAPVSIIPPDYQPLIRYIYCTTGLPFGGTFIIPPGGKPFRGVLIVPRRLEGFPPERLNDALHPLYPRDYDGEGAVSAPERLNNAPLVSYHRLAIIEF